MSKKLKVVAVLFNPKLSIKDNVGVSQLAEIVLKNYNFDFSVGCLATEYDASDSANGIFYLGVFRSNEKKTDAMLKVLKSNSFDAKIVEVPHCHCIHFYGFNRRAKRRRIARVQEIIKESKKYSYWRERPYI